MSRKQVIFPGDKFGKLTVVGRHYEVGLSVKNAYWKLVCECGNEHISTTPNLKNNKSNSCKECIDYSGRKTHGMSGTRPYHIWQTMVARCHNPNNIRYIYYGGRDAVGEEPIRVCEEWRTSFENFWEWAQNNGYEDTLTIDRIDNDLGYFPENCQWTTMKEQCQNRRKQGTAS